MYSLSVGAIQFDTDRMRYDIAAQGLTMTDLAKRAKVSNAAVTYFLKGQTRSAKMAKKLAKALGFSPRRYAIQPESQAV